MSTLSSRVARLALAPLEIDLHGDPLPLVGTVVGRHRRPLLGMLEPARAELEVALALVARPAPDDHGLNGQRLDHHRVGDLVDVPRSGRPDEHQLGLQRRLGLRLRCAHHRVAHTEGSHLAHPDRGIGVLVPQLTHRVRRLLRHRGDGQEVVRRRTGRLEEQPFHRADAPVGPVRQQHQRHRRAVLAVVLVVLPHRPAAAVGRILAEAFHRAHDGLVLGVVLLAALVAGEVVPGPTVAERVGVGLGGTERPPRVHRLVTVDGARAVERQHLEHPAEDHEHHERGEPGERGRRTDAGRR